MVSISAITINKCHKNQNWSQGISTSFLPIQYSTILGLRLELRLSSAAIEVARYILMDKHMYIFDFYMYITWLR